jgi:hypothetical protein
MDRHLAIVKAQKSDPVVKDATYTSTTNVIQLQEELTKPMTATPLVIMAAIANLITVGNYDKLVSNCKWNERYVYYHCIKLHTRYYMLDTTPTACIINIIQF